MRTKGLLAGGTLVLAALLAGCGGADAPPRPGSLIWAKGAGGTGSGDDLAAGVAVLSDDSVVVTGGYQGTATFGAGKPNQSSLTSAGDRDIFVARYSANGALVWAKSAGGASHDCGYGIAALDDDSVVVTGYCRDVATFGQGESNETSLTSEGLGDVFLARYNPDGTLAWAKGAGGTGNDYGGAVAVHSDGSAVVQGWFEGSATLGKGEPAVTTLDSAGGDDVFIARFDADGALLWATRAGGTGWDQGCKLAVLSDGSALVTGHFSDTADFGPGTTLTSSGSGDIYLAVYDKDGAISWARRAGGTGFDFGIGVSILPDGSFFATGSFSDAATFGPGEPKERTLASAGAWDVFIARYSSDGTLDWVKGAGGPKADSGKHVALLSDGSAVIAGSFGDPGGDSATFGQGEPNETTLPSAGWSGIFLAGYDPDGGLAWARRAGGSGSDQANCVAVLSDDSVVVTGWFDDTATFGPGEVNETTLTSPMPRDIFVARYGRVSPTVTPFGGGCSPHTEGVHAVAWFVRLSVLLAAVVLLRRAPRALRE